MTNLKLGLSGYVSVVVVWLPEILICQAAATQVDESKCQAASLPGQRDVLNQMILTLLLHFLNVYTTRNCPIIDTLRRLMLLLTITN